MINKNIGDYTIYKKLGQGIFAEVYLANHRFIKKKVVLKILSDKLLKDKDFLKTHLPGYRFLGFIPYDEALIEADLNNISPFDTDATAKTAVHAMVSRM